MQPSAPSSNNSAPSISSDPQSLPPPQPPPKTPRQHPPRQARHQDGISVGPLRRRLTSPASSTVGTSPEMATASLPPNQDATKDREKWRRVTPPERKKLSPEQNKILEDEEMPSQRPAQGEHLPNSGGMSRQHPDRSVNVGDRDTANPNIIHEKVPSRKGIWEWARAGTGRLNIIGRIPHPEWKGPPAANGHVVTSTNVANGTQSQSQSQDDFSIPSTTASDSKNEGQDLAMMAAKAEGLGIAHATTMSPSFSQTKMSSDDLVAAASSTGTPESRVSHYERVNGEHSSPSSASKDSPPSTPDTPTPQQRKKDTPARNQDMKADEGHKEVSTQQTKDDASSPPHSEGTPRIEGKAEPKTVHLSNTSAKKNKNVQNGSAGSQQVPTYKIALAPNLLTGSV